MRLFDYSRLVKRTWDTEILNLVAKIHECKGRQDLFIRQKPVELDRLVEKFQPVEEICKAEKWKDGVTVECSREVVTL